MWLRIGAVFALVGIVGVAGAVLLFLHNQVQPLGLAPAGLQSPTASPSADDPLTLTCRQPAVPGNSSSGGVAGLWVIQPGSVAGYRAHEQFEQLTSPHVAVARTSHLAGWILVVGTAGTLMVQTGCIAVDVRTLRSVDSLPGFNTADRDETARGMLNTDSHPFVVFQPYPASLALDVGSTAAQKVQVKGDLEVSGVTRPETFSLDVRLQEGQLTVAGATTIQVLDFGVEVPQGAGGFVSVDPHISLEVSLILIRP